ncbi:MAG: prepilin-type N-terminal cleavage/methylation domain-containing protein [Gammaproteobacteria bacterium]
MRQGGFTLLELLISVTLLALMATLITSGVKVASSSWDRAHARIEAAQEVRLIEQFIFRELSEARPLRVRLEDGKNSVFQGEPGRVAFTALLPTQQGVGGLYRLALYVAPHARGERLVLSYRLYRPSTATAPRSQPARRRVLLGALQQIAFDFYGLLESGSGSGWQPEWRHAQRLPEMVRLRYWSKSMGARGIIVPLRLGAPSTVNPEDIETSAESL